jgi:hypothetical protein
MILVSDVSVGSGEEAIDRRNVNPLLLVNSRTPNSSYNRT